MLPPNGPSLLHFGPFVVDLKSGELRKNSTRIRLQEKPVRVLTLLAERQGQLVSREELKKHLWPEETFVDFEAGLNTAVAKLRSALADDAAEPRYIETIPRRGYRFVTQVEFSNGDHTCPSAAAPVGEAGPEAEVSRVLHPPLSTAAPTPIENRASPSRLLKSGLLVSLLVLSAAAGASLWLFYSRTALSFNSRDSVLVADFDNQTGDPRFNQALEGAFTVSLEQSRHANIFPRPRLASVLQRMGRSPSEPVTPSLGREICQREGVRGLIAATITRMGNEYELTVELIDPQTGDVVRSYAKRSNGETHVLDALDKIAGDIRHDLGESLYQIHTASRRLPEVTTSSLTALKQYTDGSRLWHEGKFSDAVTLLRAAVQTDPDFAMAHAALAHAYLSYLENDPEHGKLEYEKALELSSRTTERERMMIQVEYAHDLDHVEEADTLYRSYLDRYPDDWKMLSDYAYLLLRHGRQKEAVAQYTQILKVAPDDSHCYVELATAYDLLNDLPKALEAYSKAFELDPHWLVTGNVGLEYGGALVESGDEQKGQQVFTSMLEIPEKREDGMRFLAMLDLLHGRYAEARKRFKTCLIILQNQPSPLSAARVHLWLAFVAEGEGDTGAEARELEAAMQNFQAIGPKVVFGAWIGQAFARSGFVDRAEKIEGIIAPLSDSKSAEQSGYLHLLQGEIALSRKHQERAIELLTLANKQNPTALNAEALAHAYQQSGETDAAVTAYEQLLSRQNGVMLWEPQQRWLEAHCTLAKDYLARGDKRRAKETIGRFLAFWKDADPHLPLLEKARAAYAQTL